MTATRYHSLAVEPDSVPEELVVTTDFNKLKEFLNNYKES
jgi:anthranilate/para-aminobenzoate synthase component II